MHKILITIAYYERPKLIRNALNSVLRANEYYQNWEVGFFDDGSDSPGRPIVEEILADHMDKVSIFSRTAKEKEEAGGKIGGILNGFIVRSNADLGVMLCDDDELHPTYLKNLDKYFTINPTIPWAYSRVILYDPLNQSSEDAEFRPHPLNLSPHPLNSFVVPIEPRNRVDSSQVAWRLACNKNKGAWYPNNPPFSLDAFFYESMYRAVGPCFPTGFVGQFKGNHVRQLGRIGLGKAWSKCLIDHD